jgi:hypothetical protein
MGDNQDAFMTAARPTDHIARLELLERQTTQLNGNIQWLINRLDESNQRNEELCQANESLRHTNENLRDEIGSLRLSNKKEPKEPEVNNPPPFEGDQKNLETWITACHLKFAGQPSRFVTERQKLVYATSYLKGPPLLWINPLLNKYLGAGVNDPVPEELASFNAFSQSLKTLYGDPNLERNALTALDNLKQLGSVATYISRFAIHSPHANLNDTGLRQAFYKGLKKGIKDELATRDYSTLKELQNLATKLDSRLKERALEVQAESASSKPPIASAPRAPIRPTGSAPAIAPFSQSAPPAVRPPPAPTAPTADGSTPMELDSLRIGKLTPEGKERCIREGRCFHCRRPGHRGQVCMAFQIAGLEIELVENDEG